VLEWLRFVRFCRIKQNKPPLDLRPLKIDEQRNAKPRSYQVIDALGQVFRGEAVHALQLNDNPVPNHQIGDILANAEPITAWVNSGSESSNFVSNRGRH